MNAMRLIALTILAAMSATSAQAAEDPVSGGWKVHGKVSAFSFDLTCNFRRDGQVIGGTCYDAGTNKAHPLTRGTISGDKISWTYQSSYLLNKFEASYSGLLSGTSIKGEITAPGYRGNFSAQKQP
jgi:hypothetical protein